MQILHFFSADGHQTLEAPDPSEEVIPGLRWGGFDELLSPAYWKAQVAQAKALGRCSRLRLGGNLIEEVIACLLGGYGIKGEIGVLAFRRVQAAGLVRPRASAQEWERALSGEFVIGSRSVRYRFPKQKALYATRAIEALQDFVEPQDDVSLRDALLVAPGVGLKTASWIVRNHRSSDRVAVLDVHIVRAGQHLGLFEIGADPQKHYRAMEARFLNFAAALDVPASMLDAIMWQNMRGLPKDLSAGLSCHVTRVSGLRRTDQNDTDAGGLAIISKDSAHDLVP